MPKPFVSINLDKARNMRFGVNALCEFEDLTGKTVIESFSDMEKGKISFIEVRRMVYVSLKHEDAEITEEKAGDLIDGKFEEVFDKLAEAITLTFGKNAAGATGKN